MPPEASMFWDNAIPESCIWRLTMSEVSLRWEEIVPLVVTNKSLMLDPVTCISDTTLDPTWERREWTVSVAVLIFSVTLVTVAFMWP